MQNNTASVSLMRFLSYNKCPALHQSRSLFLAPCALRSSKVDPCPWQTGSSTASRPPSLRGRARNRTCDMLLHWQHGMGNNTLMYTSYRTPSVSMVLQHVATNTRVTFRKPVTSVYYCVSADSGSLSASPDHPSAKYLRSLCHGGQRCCIG